MLRFFGNLSLRLHARHQAYSNSQFAIANKNCSHPSKFSLPNLSFCFLKIHDACQTSIASSKDPQASNSEIKAVNNVFSSNKLARTWTIRCLLPWWVSAFFYSREILHQKKKTEPCTLYESMDGERRKNGSSRCSFEEREKKHILSVTEYRKKTPPRFLKQYYYQSKVI